MFIGHYGIGLALKPVEKRISLGLLFLTVMLPDILLWGFVLLGIEHVAIEPGYTRWIPYRLYDIAFSHSLAGSLFWSFLSSGIAFLVLTLNKESKVYRLKAICVIFAAVFSHFILDLLVHVPDIPLSDNQSIKIGMGLYNSPLLSNLMEILLIIAGLIIYTRKTTAVSIPGKYLIFVFIILLVIIQLLHGFSGPPKSVSSMALTNVAFLLFIALIAQLADRYRR